MNRPNTKPVQRRLTLFLPPLLLGSPATTLAADAVRGQELAKLCTVCHAADGDAVNPLVPKLAGQNTMYLIKAMQEFRDKKRISSSMNALFGKKSDADIEDLAAWFNSIPIRIGE